MRILLLSQWCWPEPDVRIYPLAQGLAERGHEVTILTGFPNYPQGKLYEGYRLKLWQRERHDGVHIIRIPLYPSHDRSSLRRVLNYFSFALSASVLGPFFSKNIDITWVYHPPLTIGVPAWWIALLRQMPFVYEIQDMWPETVAESGMLSNPLALRGLNALAQFVYHQASALTVISPGFKNNLIQKGVPVDKITVIPNWGTDHYHPVARDSGLGDQYGLAGRFNVVFGGNMGPAQALPTALDAAALLTDLPDVQFVFIGDGIDLPALKQQSEQANLENVRFIGRQPGEMMPAFYAWADALLVQLRNDPLFAMTIPSKTQAYLASGKPILCGVPGDGADVVREAGAGLVFEPENPEALALAVRQLHAKSPEERAQMGQNGRAMFEKNYVRSVILDQYDALFQELAHP